MVGIVLAIILLIGGLFIRSNNKAIFLEEQINAAQADINVAEKRRYDIVFIWSMPCSPTRIMRVRSMAEYRLRQKQHGTRRCRGRSNGNYRCCGGLSS